MNEFIEARSKWRHTLFANSSSSPCTNACSAVANDIIPEGLFSAWYVVPKANRHGMLSWSALTLPRLDNMTVMAGSVAVTMRRGIKKKRIRPYCKSTSLSCSLINVVYIGELDVIAY